MVITESLYYSCENIQHRLSIKTLAGIFLNLLIGIKILHDNSNAELYIHQFIDRSLHEMLDDISKTNVVAAQCCPCSLWKTSNAIARHLLSQYIE